MAPARRARPADRPPQPPPLRRRAHARAGADGARRRHRGAAPHRPRRLQGRQRLLRSRRRRRRAVRHRGHPRARGCGGATSRPGSGGDEFAVLLLDCSLEDAMRVADDVITGISGERFPVARDCRISASVGVVSLPRDGIGTDGLWRRPTGRCTTPRPSAAGACARADRPRRPATVGRHERRDGPAGGDRVPGRRQPHCVHRRSPAGARRRARHADRRTLGHLGRCGVRAARVVRAAARRPGEGARPARRLLGAHRHRGPVGDRVERARGSRRCGSPARSSHPRSARTRTTRAPRRRSLGCSTTSSRSGRSRRRSRTRHRGCS